MKKLLLSLMFFSSLAIANNNPDLTLINSLNNTDLSVVGDLLPDANYAGTFSTYTGKQVRGHGSSTNNLMTIDLEQLPELCNYTGKLTVDVVLNGSKCSSKAAMLHLNEGGCKFLRDIPIEFTACNWDGSHLKGSYKVKPLPIMTGNFDFIKQ